MARQSVLAVLLRICAVLVALAGVTCVFVFADDFRAPVTPAKVALPVLCLLLSLGWCGGLIGVAALLEREPEQTEPETARALARVQAQLAEVAATMSEQRTVLERVTRDMQQHRHDPAPTPPAYAGIGPSDLEPLYQALHEIRDLTLLSDDQRREKLEKLRRERRALWIKQSFDLVAARQWPQAERVVLQLENEYGPDDEIAKCRNYLNHSRHLQEAETVTRTAREIEALMSSAAWDQAMTRARSLADGFPDNAQAQALVARVQREKHAFEETTVQRMFDELRHDIDRRIWRRALMHAERLLERYPDHPRADGVRRQLKTIQDNAEIEERQEQEVRIQELMKARRFPEAIELAEDLIRRYPLSPQAESLETLLPRIRELAQAGMAEFSGLSPGVSGTS